MQNNSKAKPKTKRIGRGNPIEVLRPWKKGQSGNPNGVPQWYRDLRGLFREHSLPALARLVELARDPSNKKIALMACQELLDRAGLQGFKIEPDRSEISGGDGQPFRLSVAFVEPERKPKG